MNTIIIHSAPEGAADDPLINMMTPVSKIVPYWGFDKPMVPGAIHVTTQQRSRGGPIIMVDNETGEHTSVSDMSFAGYANIVAENLVYSDHFVAAFLNALADRVHTDNVKAGWWSDLRTGHSILHSRNVPEMLCLVHSEISEAMEGHRKNLADDKLPHRPMLQTELVDALIRIFDLLGSRTAIDREIEPGAVPHMAGDIFVEKRAYNAQRADHKPENRVKDGGKAF